MGKDKIAAEHAGTVRDVEEESGRSITGYNLVAVYCVLSALLVTVLFLLYLLCKHHRKRRSNRNASCNVQPCVCGCRRPPSCNHLLTTHDIHNGVYSQQQHGPSINYPGQRVSAFPMDHPSHLQTMDDIHPGCDVTSPWSAVQNPAYNDSLDDHECAVFSQHATEEPIKDLFKVTERSFTQTVCGKLLVSVARNVGYKGCVLYLDNMGISLHVPEGAVRQGQSKLVVLVLNWDLSDNPAMNKEESLVSPVVYVGPHGLKLDKHCTLTFRHCAFNPSHIRVMRSKTDLTSKKAWETAVIDQDDPAELVYLIPDECQLKIDAFSLYTCVHAPIGRDMGKKWLQVAVFACPLRKVINHHQVRIYFLNKTNCALQWAIQNEAKFGGKLVCPEKLFLFDGSELDMFVQTRYLSDGWELVDKRNSEKISFLQIWHGQCPHISVCFRRSVTVDQSSRTAPVAIEMTIHTYTYQDTLDKDGEKMFIQVLEDDNTPLSEHEIRCNHQIEIQINNYSGSCGASNKDNQVMSETATRSTKERTPTPVLDSRSDNVIPKSKSENVKVIINNTQSSFPNKQNYTSMKGPTRLLPHSLRKRLILLLDPPKAPYGQDWKDLATELGLDACIPKLQTYCDPTAELLNVIEDRGKTYSEIKSMFLEIDRNDCVKEIDNYLEIGASKHARSITREPSENTEVDCKYNEGRSRMEREGYGEMENNWQAVSSSRQRTISTYSKCTREKS